VRENLIGIVIECMLQYDIEDELVQLNKNQLYELGENSKGVKLNKYRSKYYADMKANMRNGKELTDLFLSGNFQRHFFIVIEGDMYGISSTDSKTAKLIEKYGDDIFGFTEENKVNAFLIIKPALVQKIKEILQV
jgi:hypothetical protein